jgi:hypothetical protein
MNKSILQEYLNLQFIPLDDDSALDKLKKASAEIAKKLQKDKTKIIPYTLVALDPQVPADDSTLVEVKETVIKQWSVFATKASDCLVTYLRAVILEALQNISDNQGKRMKKINPDRLQAFPIDAYQTIRQSFSFF